MDAVEFIKEETRMCASYQDCTGCPPVKTRQSAFLEQWPNAEIDCQGVIAIDPCFLDSTMKDCCRNGNCYECRRYFWTKEAH